MCWCRGQECKGLNGRLLTYLKRPDTVQKLLDYLGGQGPSCAASSSSSSSATEGTDKGGKESDAAEGAAAAADTSSAPLKKHVITACEARALDHCMSGQISSAWCPHKRMHSCHAGLCWTSRAPASDEIRFLCHVDVVRSAYFRRNVKQRRRMLHPHGLRLHAHSDRVLWLVA